jgi:hypothetical protein
MVLAMQRSATVRVLLAILGVVFLLANPAGACAGVMAGHSAPASHPCCPTPSADPATSSCICIDRQPAAPTVPAPGEQAEAAVLAAAPAIALESPLEVAEFFVSDEPSPEPHAILLSIHQLLL